MADQTGATLPAPPKLTGTILDYAGHSEESRASLDPNAKPYKEGRPAQHERGVQWIGPWEQPYDGFATHTRRSVRALALQGVPVQLRDVSPKASPNEVTMAEMYDLLNTSIANYEMRVVQVVPDHRVLARWVYHKGLSEDDSAARNNATVLYTVWERENLDRDVVATMSRAGQLWVACRRNARALIDAGAPDSKVKVIPVPYFPDDPHLALQNRPRLPGVHRFLHIGKWESRKAQDVLLHGFMLEFVPGEAELIIKTSKYGPTQARYPGDPAAAIARALEDPRVVERGWTQANVSPSIRMVRESLTDKQMVALHAWSDTYCTVSHGEGFDMPAFNAALAGRRLVYTRSGGPEDFTNEHDVQVEFTGMEPVDPWYEWEKDAVWTNVNVEQVAAALRSANDRGYVRIERDLSSFSIAEVGLRTADLLREQAQTFGGSIG